VDEERRGAGAGERGGNLSSDVTGLAHSTYHYAPSAVQNQFERGKKRLIDARNQACDRICLNTQHLAGKLQSLRGQMMNWNRRIHGAPSGFMVNFRMLSVL
jgi:hypothetical protein